MSSNGGPAERRFDWAKARARLEAAMTGTVEGKSGAGADPRAVLDARARRYGTIDAVAEGKDELEVVTFVLSGERYGLEAQHVREVVGLVDYTPVPSAPPFVVGVTNLRGEILVIVDLRQLFGVAVRGLTDLSRVLVLGAETADFGVLADDVLELANVPVDSLRAPPEMVARNAHHYVRGVTPSALIVLDAVALLTDERWSDGERRTE